MNIEAFELLSQHQQLKTLIAEGKVIGEKKDNEHRSFLYYFGSFYVAVKFNALTGEFVSTEALHDIYRKDRIEWKVLRMLPALKQVIKSHSNELL